MLEWHKATPVSVGGALMAQLVLVMGLRLIIMSEVLRRIADVRF